MTQMTPRHRSFVLVVGGLTAALTLAAFTITPPAEAKRQKRKRAKSLTVIPSTPLGLQGDAGAGERAVLPFALIDRGTRRVDIQVQYGVDLDGDGEIADGTDPNKPSEYRSATHSHRDVRDTGRVKQKASGARVVTYKPSRGGASHSFVWDSAADLGRARHVAGQQIVRDETGRAVPDPFEPGEFVFSEEQPGVVLRVRAVRRNGKRQRTDWEYTDAFSLDNSRIPEATVDGVESLDTELGVGTILWTAFDDDSEDANGNGVLDALDLEDRDGDGQLDDAPVAVAFDFYVLQDGERVPTSALELAELDWQACTRADGFGDPDDGVASAPLGVGREAAFAWDFHADLEGPEFSDGRYLVRAIPFDELGNVGDPAYLLEPIVIDSSDQ
jgi:hypothetical protein